MSVGGLLENDYTYGVEEERSVSHGEKWILVENRAQASSYVIILLSNEGYRRFPVCYTVILKNSKLKYFIIFIIGFSSISFCFERLYCDRLPELREILLFVILVFCFIFRFIRII